LRGDRLWTRGRPTALLSQIWSSRPSKLATLRIKREKDLRHECQELRIKLARIESVLVQKDANFYR
jgi:hypothetical protein